MSNLRVLIIDDNLGLAKTLVFILRRKGYGAEATPDGMTALALLEEEQFDVIFLDVRMPGLNGVETLRRIRELRPKACVFLMTAYALKELTEEAVREGARTVLRKPLDVDQVLTLIEGCSPTSAKD